MQAQDRRRYTAPEGSTALQYTSDEAAPVASTSAVRLDGRQPAQVRPVYLQAGLVTGAAGSAYIEAGRTKLLCAVYGPKPTPPSAPFSPKARLQVEVKFAPFASGQRRFVPGKDTEASALAVTLQQSLLPALLLETLPKSQIDLFLTVLESDGWDGDVSIGVTAASVALASAGISMRGLVTGCSAVLPDSQTQAWLDPTREEVRQAKSYISLACIPAMGTVTNLRLSGECPPAILQETLTSAREVCALLHGAAQKALLAQTAQTDDKA
ncbi:hypothetical protein BMF94_2979 [Rhodotorula taiwanensis]|uniref:Exoribonuclease phosphorolytic domain-containing protein n=1 Tax=Rhodotorula taiwanensis TaxID=741276 RepID=A0A2S5BB00_9BASI|nr:hypothetical protein BMF94_2979 [Rhodotorula taiwanensis]